MIDGQLRYEVAQNLASEGRPIIRDKALKFLGVRGRYGLFYAHYGALGSVLGVPLIWLGSLTPDPGGETRRFLFSLTSCFLGALTAAVLYMFHVELGVSKGVALAWTLVSSFATLLWPASTSSFDNVQHAFFALLAVFLGYRSATERSSRLAAWGGLSAGLLILYQEYFVILIPALALSTLAPPAGETGGWNEDAGRDTTEPGERPRRPKVGSIRNAVTKVRHFLVSVDEHAQSRYVLFVGCAGIGLALALGYNLLRFGSIFTLGNLQLERKAGFPLFGDPLIGLPTLLVSPGKSIMIYSPPIILGFAGIRHLWRRKPYLGCSIVATSIILVLFLSNIAFLGGDWCWGPRYVVPLLPLWALAFPFVPSDQLRRWPARAVVGAGLVVQLMALAVDHQRFFFERALPDYFWADDPWYYFTDSALASRPAEIFSLREGAPKTGGQFAPGPYRNSVTYCIFGNPLSQRSSSPRWMRQFPVFYVPRPWPLWMRLIEPGRRPINTVVGIAGSWAVAMAGIVCIYFALRSTVRG